jgi:hypothetical protein
MIYFLAGLLGWSIFGRSAHLFWHRALKAKGLPKWVEELAKHERAHHAVWDHFWVNSKLNLNFPMSKVLISVAAAFLVALLLLGLPHALLFTAGFQLGNLVDSTAHRIVHTQECKRWPMKWIQEKHMIHHESYGLNLGMLSGLWLDKLFGSWK